MSQNITLMGASYSDVPAVLLPKTGGGTARFDDASVTTAAASDVASGKLFLASDGTITEGTSSGGGSELVVGALRPDAELWKSWTYDKLLVQDEGVTLPSYSTSAQTVKASETLETVSLNCNEYAYAYITRTLANPVYSTTTKSKGRWEYQFIVGLGELVVMKGTDITVDGKSFANWTGAVASATANRGVYWSSATALSNGVSLSYGTYMGLVTPTMQLSASAGTATLVFRSPTMSVRGNTTYFTSTNWGYMTDIRCQYVIELYRTPLGSMNINHYGLGSSLDKIIGCIANGGTLS